MVMPQDIDANRRFHDAAKIGMGDYERLSRHALRACDIVFARRGEVDKHAFIHDADLPALCGTGCLRVRVNKDKANPEFISYYLNNPESKQYLRAHAVGSNMPNLNTDILSNIELSLPDIQQQNYIVSLLSSIDKKIETNTRIITELESLARTIYDYWFTQFDFPDEYGNPYHSSGGAMVHDEALHRDIPKDWGTIHLREIVDLVDDKCSHIGLSVDNYISTDNMLKKRGGICPSAYLPVEGRVTRFQQNDILLSNIRPYFKKIWLSDRIGGCCADVLVFRAKHREHTEWLYQTMAADPFFSYVSIGAKGSKMPRGDKEHMMRYPVAMPPKELLCVFSKLYSPMHNQIAKLYKENIHLANLRDWLLPLLMNGQATIDK